MIPVRTGVARIVAFTAIAVVVYAIIIAVVPTVLPPDPAGRGTAATLGVGLGAVVAYYAVYIRGLAVLEG